jgi:hypothetical protein
VAQVRLVEVAKSFGAEPAVDRVSFTAEAALRRRTAASSKSPGAT